MTLARKLQLKPGQKVLVVNRPEGLVLDAPTTARSGDAVLVFARNRADLERHVTPALEAARVDRLSWIAYPKAGQLDTDLNRDILRKALATRGVKAVRQVALDGLWSALRFRPAR